MTLTTTHRAATAPANAAAAPANAATAPANPAADRSSEPSTDHLLRIQEVSEEVGLTPRSIRYYEERGLLKPAARSEGAYRLYDTDDIDRLRFIKGLRDDAGFSLSDIGQLLEDESARARIRARYRETTDRGERRALLLDGIARIDRQVASLRSKIERLQAMVDAAATRRGHLQDHIDELDGKIATVPGHEPDEAAAGRATSGPTTTRRTAR